MHVPNEIILYTIQDLSKADLKAARLVNKQWSSCAVEPLFETLYISPHKINMDVFQSVTQHPALRHCVMQLRYESVGFATKWTYSDYFGRLLDQVAEVTYAPEGSFGSPDTQINSFLEVARCYHKSNFDPYNFRSAEKKCSEFNFIKTGYKKWMEHALYEQKCMENNQFLQILGLGLRRLDRLSTVRLSDRWPPIGEPKTNADVSVRREGSPLARSWGFLDATPLDWSWGPAGDLGFDLCSPGFLAFWNITVALSENDKRIRSLKIRDAVPHLTFDSRSIATGERQLHGVNAFAWLKELRLAISFWVGHPSNPTPYDNLSGLKTLFYSMCDLEVLELYLPRDKDDWEFRCFTQENIFPKDAAWPQLRQFTVQAIAIRRQQLIHLLFAQMPNLQHLKIDDMHLLDGTWESVIEALKFRRLSSFDIKSSYRLSYDDGQDLLAPFFDRLNWDFDEDYFERLEKYVVHGIHDWTLRHPSLEEGQPTQDSLNFLDGIFDQADGIEYIADIDFADLKRQIADVCAEENCEREMAEGRRAALLMSTNRAAFHDSDDETL